MKTNKIANIAVGQILYTRAQSAMLLSLSLGTLDKLISTGQLVASRIGSKVVIHRDDVAAYADGLRKQVA